MIAACPVTPPATADALLDAVDEIRQVVELGRAEGDERRTLPRATADVLARSGLLAMKVPSVLGGAEADLVTQVRVIESLARVDATAAWCLMVGASAIAWPAAFLADEAVAEIFRTPRPPHASVVVQPTGTAASEAGGYRLSGQWSFASGIRHADWIVAGALVKHGDRPPRRHIMVVVPAAAAEIHDDWHVCGLEATGSCSFSLRDVFVPAAFTWDFLHGQPKRGGSMYRLGWPGFVVHEPPAFALGVARRSLDELATVASRPHRGPSESRSQAESRAFQQLLGEAEIEWRAARALVLEAFGAAWLALGTGQSLSARTQAELRSVSALVMRMSTDIALRAFRAGGGASVYRSSILQRCTRDLMAAGQHWLAREAAHETFGRAVLGIADDAARG